MQETEQDKQNRAQTAKRLSSEGRKYFNFIEFDADEELITEIRKHPFGLFLIFAGGVFVTLALTGILYVISRADLASFAGNAGSAGSFKSISYLIGFFLIVGSIVITLIAAFLYVSNVIFVTSDKIAQVLYTSLFTRKISHLSIGDLQDVTVTQKGIFATIFNYGTLVVETAGEQQNYTFTFVPEPYQVSKMIVGTHELNLKRYGN
jgi:uncharacterized membrane protein YdbT with pleckstrin-like domain